MPAWAWFLVGMPAGVALFVLLLVAYAWWAERQIARLFERAGPGWW